MAFGIRLSEQLLLFQEISDSQEPIALMLCASALKLRVLRG